MKQNLIPISKQVSDYIKKKPFVQEAIEQGIVNFSALAKNISKEFGRKHFNAVKAALIREASKSRLQKKRREEKVIELIKKSNFSIKNKMAIVKSAVELNIENIAFSYTPSGFIYFVEENVARKKRLKNAEFGFAIIYIKNDLSIEDIPGVTAFMVNALASEDINMVHLVDCREDTFIVIEEIDAPLAFKALAERTRIDKEGF